MAEDLSSIILPPSRHWDRGGTRPVLALHCSLAHAGAWGPLAEHLNGITLTATDQIGHGRARDWDGVSNLHLEGLHEAIATAQEIGGGRPVDVFGHSFGATVGLLMALERPDLVRSLTLVEPVIFAAARRSDPAEYARFREDHLAFGAMITGGQRHAGAALFHSRWGGGDRFDDLAERTRTYMLDRIHLIVAQNGFLLDDASEILRPGGLESIRVPVLLVEGADSPPIIDAVHRALMARLPIARRLVVEGAGHMVSITHAAEVARSVQAQLDAC